MKTIVIGAGLGGLLSAARLSKAGHEVEVFERLPITGGRFTNLSYKGFQLSSGAFHMLPNGPGGPLAQLLREAGASVDIVRSDMTTVRVPLKKGNSDYVKGFKDISFSDFSSLLSYKDRMKIALLIVSTRKNRPSGSTLQAWIKTQVNDEWLIKFADSFCGWALSLKSDEVPVEEVFEILEAVIMANGGKIHTGQEVSKILVENGKAAGIVAEGKKHDADLVISNLGHAATALLCGEALSKEANAAYLKMLKSLRPSAGIKICLAADEPLVGHSGVLLTPYSRRINGINEVTQVDPKLAPPGKHLTMCHQYVAPENVKNLESEIEMGLADVKEIFPDKRYEVLLIQSYHDEWPVNRAASGTDPGNETPFSGLYVVGDGAKGKGGIEVEGVALGVASVLGKILS